VTDHVRYVVYRQ